VLRKKLPAMWGKEGGLSAKIERVKKQRERGKEERGYGVVMGSDQVKGLIL
jgi:hypothetical protein